MDELKNDDCLPVFLGPYCDALSSMKKKYGTRIHVFSNKISLPALFSPACEFHRLYATEPDIIVMYLCELARRHPDRLPVLSYGSLFSETVRRMRPSLEATYIIRNSPDIP